jgi:hypothetical protein
MKGSVCSRAVSRRMRCNNPLRFRRPCVHQFFNQIAGHRRLQRIGTALRATEASRSVQVCAGLGAAKPIEKLANQAPATIMTRMQREFQVSDD